MQSEPPPTTDADDKLVLRRKQRNTGIALATVTAVVEGMAHAPSVFPALGPVLKWPRLVLVGIGGAFFVWILLPDAWHHRRSDPGGLFFVICMIGIGLFAAWALLDT